ncbi:Major facilitator superfamily domain general substrate transporter [Penicillium malachiteum]|uniref:Major facilitator superfamily domain general substrate transporter n=1 Tax=Penicillium malachiteum TaxID=1324776 RepID=A0AAD6HI74_9EURO|nr:Major facilitator superfamily domain general substrate transporter [Penicillium malachiteum]
MGTETNPQIPEPLTGSATMKPELHDKTQRLSFTRLIAAYLCLCACYFISYLDMNSTTTALATISTALSAGTTITWAGTAFLLGQTVFQPLYGRISDIVGRKPVLLVSVGCIFIGDLLSDWAQSALWLYLAQALSGIGAGGISSLVAIIISDLVSLKERGKYQGMVSIAIGLGSLAGPFVAGSLVEKSENSWRWVFWVPSILAFVCAITLVFLLPLKPVHGNWQDKVTKVDWYGVLASVTGIVLILVTQYFMPLYFQELRGFSPLKSATLTLPYVLAQSLAGAVSGPLMSRFARYALVLRAGFFLWTLGAGLNLLFTQHTHIAVYVVVLAIEGAGVGLVHQPGLVAVQALSRAQDRAVATSTRNLLRSLGSVFGVAISTAVQNAAIKSSLYSVIPSETLSEVLEGSWSSSDTSTKEYRSQILDAKMKGFRVVFIILVPIMCVCFLGTFFVADRMLKGDENDMKEKGQEGARPVEGEVLESSRSMGNLNEQVDF